MYNLGSLQHIDGTANEWGNLAQTPVSSKPCVWMDDNTAEWFVDDCVTTTYNFICETPKGIHSNIHVKNQMSFYAVCCRL